MFELIAFAREAHENAVAHGWWEKPRSAAGVRALIHSEWSEALEEARAGRPMVWHMCMDHTNGPAICENQTECPCKLDAWETDCPAYEAKPEGVAVELIDGCIRILDYIANEQLEDKELTVEECKRIGRMECTQGMNTPVCDMELDEVVDTLHLFTAASRHEGSRYYWLRCAIGVVLEWVSSKGLNPETIIQQKHRYNKTRPYKHGKKF